MTISTPLDVLESPRLRILFLVSSMGAGGTERVAALLCRQWIAQGHDVTLMPTYSRRGTCVYALDERVSLDFLADRFGGAREHPPNALRRLSALRQAVRELRPDVIVSFLTNVNIAALVATIGLGVPVVVSERSFPPRQKISTFLRVMRRASYWRAAAVVAQTGGIADWLLRYCPGAKTVVIPNPVVVPIQNSESRLEPEQHLARGRRMILSVGRCVPEKGFDRLVEAFARIAQNLPDCDLVILGEGPERRALERLCEAHGMTSRVHLPGHVGNVGDWYEAASVFVLTSHCEGFPNALLEAMAYGLPAVSVACATGPADIIRDGIDGVLVPGDSNAAGIAVALCRIMRDEETREAMGRRAREVAERFSTSSIGTSWNTLLLSARGADSDSLHGRRSPEHEPHRMSKASPRIMHVISGLSVGGTERALYNLLAGGLSSRFEHQVVSLSGQGVFGPEIRRLGVQVESLALRRSFDSCGALSGLARIAARFEPDLIQGWMYHGNLFAALLRCLAQRRAVLAWNLRQCLPDLELEKPVTRLVIRANKQLSRRPELMLFNSSVAMNDHAAFGFSVARAAIIPNGFAVRHWYAEPAAGQSTREALGIPATALVIGHVARLHTVKDHPSFLRAAVRIAREHDSLHVLLSGTGVVADNPALAGLVPKELRPRFHFLGERDDVVDLMRAMDVFCLSSVREAFPNVLGEAMATGVPCVTTDVGDSANLVGDTGIIVPARDEAALMRGLLRLVSKPIEERRALGVAARARVEANYSLDAVVQQYVVTYEDLLAMRSAN